jgi:hypothetical protein
MTVLVLGSFALVLVLVVVALIFVGAGFAIAWIVREMRHDRG